MIRHVVVFRWNDTVTDAAIAAIGAALDALPTAIAEIAEYRHGRDLQLGPTNSDYSIVGDFGTVEDYLVYRDHPVHQQFIADHITGRVADRVAVQFEF
ncbi:MAG: Dabb family protein [Acidimicrobiales bacterium]|nr:MAG: Dabb family protein [Acidimicrobiales bacterium]